MKLFLAVATAAGLVAGSVLAQDPSTAKADAPAQAGDLKDLKQKASYSYGYRLGLNLKKQTVEIDAQSLAQGLGRCPRRHRRS